MLRPVPASRGNAPRWLGTISLVGIVAWSSILMAPPPEAQELLEDCGSPFSQAGQFGPFDYRTAREKEKLIVERAHFTNSVETLRAGKSGPIGGDLDYTLRAFPNHPRALMAMIRLGQREKTARPKGAQYSVACYVERAVRYRPDDPNVRQIKGIFLMTQGRHENAITEFLAAIERSPTDASAHYNLGLAYVETKNYDRAVEEAKIARSLGYTLEGLSKKLKAVGKSVE